MDHRGGEKLYHLAPLFSIEQPSYLSRCWDDRIPFLTCPHHAVEYGQQLPHARGEGYTGATDVELSMPCSVMVNFSLLGGLPLFRSACGSCRCSHPVQSRDGRAWDTADIRSIASGQGSCEPNWARAGGLPSTLQRALQGTCAGVLLRFTGFQQALVEVTQYRVATTGHQCAHIQRRAHRSSTAPHGTFASMRTAVPIERRHTDQGSDLLAVQRAQFRQIRE